MTSLNRWDPFQDMLTLREAMNQLLEESVVRPGATRNTQGFVPALDLSETPDAFHVELAVPGLKPENLDLTFENNVLTIKGEIRQENQDSKRNFHRVERRYGTFQRTLTLPTTVNPEAISADLSNGVLTLVIPKAEAVKPRKISIGLGQEKAITANNN